jgi:hypothetical protein
MEFTPDLGYGAIDHYPEHKEDRMYHSDLTVSVGGL